MGVSKEDIRLMPAFFGYLGSDWRADGYRWRQNGMSGLPKSKPLLTKIHFDVCTADGPRKSFRKFVYRKEEELKPGYVLVQYVGDASSVASFPHGAFTSHFPFDCLLNVLFVFVTLSEQFS